MLYQHHVRRGAPLAACWPVCARVCCLLLLSLLTGCSTYADHLREIRQEFYSGEIALASARIDKQLKRPRGDANVLKLERSMIELCTGRPQQAEKLLREVRDEFDYLDQTNLGESTLAMLTDDNAVAYAGEDYEKVLIRSMLALANLMHDGGDARAYSLQVTDKQNQIVESGTDQTGNNPKLAYKRVAFGAYLEGVLCEATHNNYDDVARSWAKVVSWEPDFRHGQADLQRATYGRHSAPGNGVLYVFTLVGQGPYKEETIELPSTAALLIADRIISHNANHTLPPTIAPIKVPKVVVPVNEINTVRVSVNGQMCGTTETVTDIGQLALQQYEAIYPQVLARAVVRRAVKKGIVYASKEAMGVDNSLVNFAMDAGGVVWEATEAADTRCWGLLPAQIQVLRVELPAGDHQIGLTAASGQVAFGTEETAKVHIANGHNTYVLVNFPHRRMVGQIVTSRP